MTNFSRMRSVGSVRNVATGCLRISSASLGGFHAKWSHEPKTYSRRSQLNLIAPLRLSIVDLNLEHWTTALQIFGGVSGAVFRLELSLPLAVHHEGVAPCRKFGCCFIHGCRRRRCHSALLAHKVTPICGDRPDKPPKRVKVPRGW